MSARENELLPYAGAYTKFMDCVLLLYCTLEDPTLLLNGQMPQEPWFRRCTLGEIRNRGSQKLYKEVMQRAAIGIILKTDPLHPERGSPPTQSALPLSGPLRQEGAVIKTEAEGSVAVNEEPGGTGTVDDGGIICRSVVRPGRAVSNLSEENGADKVGALDKTCSNLASATRKGPCCGSTDHQRADSNEGAVSASDLVYNEFQQMLIDLHQAWAFEYINGTSHMSWDECCAQVKLYLDKYRPNLFQTVQRSGLLTTMKQYFSFIDYEPHRVQRYRSLEDYNRDKKYTTQSDESDETINQQQNHINLWFGGQVIASETDPEPPSVEEQELNRIKMRFGIPVRDESVDIME
ncbi:hypothetical protein GNI_087350 [Gregarina niphandrodes]|uniref:Uncharacterized protein n=1 Tax=Gregarina niphandrodes TaxID=110365 RepID=A0A023B642_GRENI|nr:hypothetical protein GNI_087350 [Gregarina niphandrodes]EZG62966.1 hypothetical protein GNI_087350 [Gregarina niphandrodes]|eukprot:XP_011130704.1 hypothetical protein GNI_087350 [Gregarina niphandrodes]